jgi:hypothetical protein
MKSTLATCTTVAAVNIVRFSLKDQAQDYSPCYLLQRRLQYLYRGLTTLLFNFDLHQPYFARHWSSQTKSLTGPECISWDERTVWPRPDKQAECTIGAFGFGVSAGPGYLLTAVDLPRTVCKLIRFDVPVQQSGILRSGSDSDVSDLDDVSLQLVVFSVSRG